MTLHPVGCVAVIFCTQRTNADEPGYAAAALAMSERAAQQPGYLGQDSSRSEDGLGITISYWEDDTAAKAWRDDAEHTTIRDQGRKLWYENYTLHVVRVERSYDWKK